MPPGAPRPTAQLREYFAGERTEFDLPLAPAGSEFQRTRVGRAAHGSGTVT